MNQLPRANDAGRPRTETFAPDGTRCYGRRQWRLADGHSGRASTLIVSAAFGLLYVALDAVSYVFPYHPFPVTPWNPNAGLAIAIIVAGGPQYAPAALLAALVSELPLHVEGVSLIAKAAAGLGIPSISRPIDRSQYGQENQVGRKQQPSRTCGISLQRYRSRPRCLIDVPGLKCVAVSSRTCKKPDFRLEPAILSRYKLPPPSHHFASLRLRRQTGSIVTNSSA